VKAQDICEAGNNNAFVFANGSMPTASGRKPDEISEPVASRRGSHFKYLIGSSLAVWPRRGLFIATTQAVSLRAFIISAGIWLARSICLFRICVGLIFNIPQYVLVCLFLLKGLMDRANN
jgi:hypothetical protein